jgi:hypothetical protein
MEFVRGHTEDLGARRARRTRPGRSDDIATAGVGAAIEPFVSVGACLIGDISIALLENVIRRGEAAPTSPK